MNKLPKWVFGLWFALSLFFVGLFVINAIFAGFPWVLIVVFSILIALFFWLLFWVSCKLEKIKIIYGGFMGYVCPKCKNRLKVTEHGTHHVDYDCVICGWHKDKKI